MQCNVSRRQAPRCICYGYLIKRQFIEPVFSFEGGWLRRTIIPILKHRAASLCRDPVNAAKRHLPDNCCAPLPVLLTDPSERSCTATENPNMFQGHAARRNSFPQGHSEKHSKPVPQSSETGDSRVG